MHVSRPAPSSPLHPFNRTTSVWQLNPQPLLPTHHAVPCRYCPAFVPRWPLARSTEHDMEVAESVTAWLPPDMSDGVLGGTDRLVETSTTATYSELLAANPVSAHATQDMSNLLYMEAQHVLHNLKQRFEWQLIHTFVGGMLVVCNPYVFLPHLYPPFTPLVCYIVSRAAPGIRLL